MIETGVLAGARLTHRTGTVDDLAAVSPADQREAVAELLSVPGVEEAFVLSTCNRVEAYVVAPDPASGAPALEAFFADARAETVVRTDHEGSLHHLLRVAAGLESAVVGEDQILGQVRRASEDARACGGVGPVLETCLTKAIHVGERARTETEINDGIVSLGSAATALAARERDLEGADALVVGAGEMGRLAARSLVDAGVGRLTVANRTVANAEAILETLESDGVDHCAVGLEELERVGPAADVVVAATDSDSPVLEPHHVGEATVVDLGQPRDVHPAVATRPGTTVYDLDDLESLTEDTREQRADAAREVEAMIDAELDRLLEQYKRSRADAVIAAMYESAERMKARELETAFGRLETSDGSFTDDQREIVAAMADALVSQLLAPPTKSLREAAGEDDWRTINTALQLFDPEFGPEPPAALIESAGDADAGGRGLEVADDD